MNEFSSRTDPVSSVVSATERGVRVVAPVSPVAPSADVTQETTQHLGYALSTSEVAAQSTDDRAKAAAAYAKVRAGVSSAIATLGAQPAIVEGPERVEDRLCVGHE